MKKILCLLTIITNLSLAVNVKGDINIEGGYVRFLSGKNSDNSGNIGGNVNFKVQIPETLLKSDKTNLYFGGGVSQEILINKNLTVSRTKVNVKSELEYLYTKDLKPYLEINAGIGAIYNNAGSTFTGGAGIGTGIKYKNTIVGISLGIDNFKLPEKENTNSFKVGAKIGYEFDILKTNK
ncbi:hypothetical protein [Streptobacillus canis]|uniref:hypothetical protein n=1 Tax=Streptobacillus canis TaxID=2678686 RepID=UPI0012E2C1EA|nr:hypothetical protein [Streptobacillus canis]